MNLQQIILGAVLGAIAIALGVYVSFTARCKGPILSNTYLWATPEQRKKMDLKKEYHLVTVVFSGLTALFFLLTIQVFTLWEWLRIGIAIVLAFLVIYAIANAVKAQRDSKIK